MTWKFSQMGNNWGVNVYRHRFEKFTETFYTGYTGYFTITYTN